MWKAGKYAAQRATRLPWDYSKRGSTWPRHVAVYPATLPLNAWAMMGTHTNLAFKGSARPPYLERYKITRTSVSCSVHAACSHVIRHFFTHLFRSVMQTRAVIR